MCRLRFCFAGVGLQQGQGGSLSLCGRGGGGGSGEIVREKSFSVRHSPVAHGKAILESGIHVYHVLYALYHPGLCCLHRTNSYVCENLQFIVQTFCRTLCRAFVRRSHEGLWLRARKSERSKLVGQKRTQTILGIVDHGKDL